MRAGALALAVVLLTALLAVQPAHAADPPYGVTVTRDVAITLSDGTVLRADVHAPATADGMPARGPFPVILGLTPYGKSTGASSGPGFGGLNPYLVQRGYIGVVVDVPGTGGSQGRSQLFGKDETRAAVEVIRWAARLENSTGKVGMLGESYLAVVQLFAAAAVGKGSPLKAIFPMSAGTDPYRDLFVSGGVQNMESPLGLIVGYAGLRTVTPLVERHRDPADALNLAVQHLLQTVNFELTTLAHVLLDGERRFDGAYWQERAPQRLLQRIVDNGVAVYQVGGLYDVFQRGTPLTYSGLQNAAAGRPVYGPMRPGQRASAKYQLLTGPWTHGDLGSGVDLNKLQLRWFDQWLKGRDTGITRTSTPLHVIEPGGASYDAAAYPVGATTRVQLAPGGKLSNGKPAGAEDLGELLFTGLSNPCGRSFDQWAAGGFSGAFHGQGQPAPCVDQRGGPQLPEPFELTFTSPPLREPVRLGGPLGLRLKATSTSADTVFVATVQDVAPDGSVVDLSGGALLGSMRAVDPKRSWPGADGGYLLPFHRLTRDAARPVVPGRSTAYDVEIRPVFATLKAGHRLRVVVGTGDVPHLTPPPRTAPELLGGRYTVHSGWLDLPVVQRP